MSRQNRVEMLSAGAVERQALGRLSVETAGQGFTEITSDAAAFVAQSRIRDGLLTLFCRHTSASLTIQENADPDVRVDLLTALDGFAPRTARYVHHDEGPDDMPAHVRTMLTDSALAIPVVDGRLALGTWQGVYLIEHRERPHRREIVLHVSGPESASGTSACGALKSNSMDAAAGRRPETVLE